MKKLVLPLVLLLLLALFSQSCSNTKTYAEMLQEEKEAIEAFIKREGINVISLQEFLVDSTTDVSRNEFVLFSDLGVYMQIVDEGEGKMAESGDEVIVKFVQEPLLEGYADTLSNIGLSYLGYFYHDEFRYVVSSYGTISGSFLTDETGEYTGLLYYYYALNTYYYSTDVPAGWLVPLSYVKLGRDTSKLARIRLIVPSKQGHAFASYYVLPYYYEISYQLSR